jgi:hypothetical protein
VRAFGGLRFPGLLPNCFVLKIWVSISVLLAFRAVRVFVPPGLDSMEVVCLRTLGLWSWFLCFSWCSLTGRQYESSSRSFGAWQSLAVS